jgi:hypothetical protein
MHAFMVKRAMEWMAATAADRPRAWGYPADGDLIGGTALHDEISSGYGFTFADVGLCSEVEGRDLPSALTHADVLCSLMSGGLVSYDVVREAAVSYDVEPGSASAARGGGGLIAFAIIVVCALASGLWAGDIGKIYARLTRRGLVRASRATQKRNAKDMEVYDALAQPA